MKHLLTLAKSSVAAAGITWLCSADISAQLVSGNGFLQGTYVEVGISPCGTYGSSVGAPVGYHPRGGGAGAGGTGIRLGFVADVGKDGWTAGTPNYCGDYFLPGSPEEGWGVEWTGVTPRNNNQVCSTSNIPGSVTTYSSVGSTRSATWSGAVSGLSVQQVTELNIANSYFVTRITLTNTTLAPMNNMYYMRNVDPDNEQPLTGNFTTNNVVIDQNPNPANCYQALVRATGLTYGCFLGLGARDPRARVTFGGFSNRDPSDIWNGVSPFSLSGSNTGDVAISISFNIGTLAPGASTTLAYAYVLNPADLAAAFTDLSNPSILANGVDKGTSGSVATCGNPVNLSIADGAAYTWTWSPSTGLSTTSGPVTIANPAVTTTYTAVGTSSSCGTKTLTITVTPTSGVNVTLAPSVTTCAGSPVTLNPIVTTGTAPFTYSWTPASGLSCIACSNPVATPAGTTTYTLTVTDAGGCTRTVSTTVNVVASTPVVINCPAPISVNTSPGVCGAAVTFAATATGGCGGAPVITYSHASGSIFPVGTTTVTAVATSVIGGTSATCSFTITVTDNEAPVIECPASLTLPCGSSSDPAFTGTASATDNCGVASITYSDVGSFSGCAGTGTIVRTWHATDVNGNTSVCTQTLTATDTDPPVITCPAGINLKCTYSLPAPNTSGVIASDYCSSVTVAWAGDTDNGGSACDGNPLIISRTYTATDLCGNVASCVQTITIEADPLTVNAGPNVTVYYGYPGYNCATLNATASGSCGPYTFLWSNGETTPSITVCPMVNTCYTVTVTDANGCTSTDEVCVCAVNVICTGRDNNGHGGSGQAGAGLGTIHVYVCHTPPASGWQTKCLPISAVPSHLAHGDFLGPCSVGPTPACDGPAGSMKMSVNSQSMDLTASPNPFTGSTTISFSLSMDDVADVKVYNLLGVNVASLYSGAVTGGTENAVTFHSTGLASGIYLVQLTTASGQSMTRRIMLQ